MQNELKFDKLIWLKKFYPVDNLKYNQLRLSKIGYYSITKKIFIDKILAIIKAKFKNYNDQLIITDATAGTGMISIILARYYKVNAIEKLKLHVDIIKNNANIYGTNNNINLIEGDYTKIMMDINQDILILDPPWEESNKQKKYYKDYKFIDLYLSDLNIIDLLNKLIKFDKIKLVIIFVPFNYNIINLIQKIKMYKISIYKIPNEKHYIISLNK